MLINDIRCDACAILRSASPGWWQVEMVNGDWRISPLTEAAATGAAAPGAGPVKHVCPKTSCAAALLQQWQERQGDGGRQVGMAAVGVAG